MAQHITYSTLLRISDVRHISAAMLLSRSAKRMWEVTLVLFVLIDYHSPGLAGACAFASMIPGLAVSPVMGALLDRRHRARLVIVDYLFAASTMVMISGLSWTHHLSPFRLLVLIGLNSLTNSLSSSGMRASLPLILPRQMWDRANGIDAATQETAKVLGPTAAGLVVGLAGPQVALLGIGVAWCVASFLLVGITIGVPNPQRHHVLVESLQGLRYVIRNATLRATAISSATAHLSEGALILCLPLLVFSRFNGTPAMVGVLWASAGITSAAAGLAIGRLRTAHIERPLYVGGVMLGGLGIAIVAAGPTIPVVALGLMLWGASSGPVNLAAWGLRQRRTDPAMFGRVLAISMSLNFCGVPIGSALAGVSVRGSVTGTLLIGTLCTVVGATLGFVLLPPEGE